MHIAGLTNVLNFSGTFNDVPCDTILNRHLRYLGKCFCDPRKIGEHSNQTPAFHNSSSNPVQSLELRKRQVLYTGVRQTQTAEWQVNKVEIVVECSNRFPIPKLDF